MSNKKIKTCRGSISEEIQNKRKQLLQLFKDCPVPDNELLKNIGLFLNPSVLRKFLFLSDIYRMILEVHGVIIEFGVRWGQNLSIFQSLRSIYEPYNHIRKIVGFDTFAGFPGVHEKDGTSEVVSTGAYGVTAGYELYLDNVLSLLEQEMPMNVIKKYELRKGNAVDEIKKYLEENPETIIALAYFDLDLYEPTKKCLEAIKGYLTRGSVLVFDELNYHDFPGETIALKEVFGLDRFSIKRTLHSHEQSYVIYK